MNLKKIVKSDLDINFPISDRQVIQKRIQL